MSYYHTLLDSTKHSCNEPLQLGHDAGCITLLLIVSHVHPVHYPDHCFIRVVTFYKDS